MKLFGLVGVSALSCEPLTLHLEKAGGKKKSCAARSAFNKKCGQ